MLVLPGPHQPKPASELPFLDLSSSPPQLLLEPCKEEYPLARHCSGSEGRLCWGMGKVAESWQTLLRSWECGLGHLFSSTPLPFPLHESLNNIMILG